MYMRVFSNKVLKVSVLLPYANPHVVDWILKLKDNVELNVGCVKSTQYYRPGYFKNYDHITSFHYFFREKHAKKEFYKNLKDSDSIIVLGVFEKELLFAGVYGQKNTRLFILSEPFNPINSEEKIFLRKLWGKVIRFLFKDISFFCIGGEDVKRYYLKLGFKKAKFFQFGYFPDFEFRPPTRKLGSEDVINISFVGQLTQRKGVDRLFRLIDYLAKSKFRYHLRIAGDGVLKQELLKKISTKVNITYLGLVSEKKRLKMLLEETDILFVPSHFDGWGAVINEGISHSCAIICSDKVYASKLLVIDNFNGFIFSDDFEYLFEKYFNDYRILDSHKRASKVIFEKWNSESVAREVIKVLEKSPSGLLSEI